VSLALIICGDGPIQVFLLL